MARSAALANRIRAMRIASRLSQEELGRRAGCSGATVSRAERGLISLRDELKCALADALGVPVWRLFYVPEPTQGVEKLPDVQEVSDGTQG